jgi:hypothetical protein
MTVRDHERFRRELEQQLRADVELIYAAYCAKLRAYEMMHQLPGEVDPGLLPPLALTLSLPPAAPEALPAAPAPAPPVPAPAPRPKSPPNELYNAVLAILDQLPETFELSHVHAALGFAPRRATTEPGRDTTIRPRGATSRPGGPRSRAGDGTVRRGEAL